MPYVYILFSKIYHRTYIGSTTDVERRLYEHNHGGNAVYTKRYRPWIIAYKEEYGTLREARDREKYFKSSAGRRYIKKHKLISNIPG